MATSTTRGRFDDVRGTITLKQTAKTAHDDSAQRGFMRNHVVNNQPCFVVVTSMAALAWAARNNDQLQDPAQVIEVIGSISAFSCGGQE